MKKKIVSITLGLIFITLFFSYVNDWVFIAWYLSGAVSGIALAYALQR